MTLGVLVGAMVSAVAGRMTDNDALVINSRAAVLREAEGMATVADWQGCITRVLEEEQSRKKAGEKIFSGCNDNGNVVAALVKGIKDAGFVREWKFGEQTGAKEGHLTTDLDGVEKLIPLTIGEDKRVTLEVTLHTDQVYGEIATASRVPVMWNLARTIKFIYQQGDKPWLSYLLVEGISVEAPKEGFDVYMKATEGVNEAGEEVRCTEPEVYHLKAQLKLSTAIAALATNPKSAAKDPTVAQSIAYAETVVGDGNAEKLADSLAIAKALASGTSAKIAFPGGKYESAGLAPCVQREMAAVDAYLRQKYASHSSKTKYDQNSKSKLAGILHTMWWKGNLGVYPIRLAIDGKGQWPTVFYSFVATAPSTFELFTFHDPDLMKTHSAPEGIMEGVSVVTAPHADWVGETEGRLYAKVHSAAPANLEGSISGLYFAESNAKSGMAFGEMVAWGNYRDELFAMGFPHMGNAKALVNLFSFCDDGTKQQPVTLNPTCKGSSIGRVSWGAMPSPRYTCPTAGDCAKFVPAPAP